MIFNQQVYLVRLEHRSNSHKKFTPVQKGSWYDWSIDPIITKMFVLERSNTVLFQLCYYWSAPIVTAPIITIGVIFHGSVIQGAFFEKKCTEVIISQK